MFYTYVLRSSSTGNLYKGQTDNLERRISIHNRGLSNYTKNRGPWKLVYSEEFDSRRKAIKRELFLKSGKGREVYPELYIELVEM